MNQFISEALNLSDHFSSEYVYVVVFFFLTSDIEITIQFGMNVVFSAGMSGVLGVIAKEMSFKDEWHPACVIIK